jgi:hypothetical protein
MIVRLVYFRPGDKSESEAQNTFKSLVMCFRRVQRFARLAFLNGFLCSGLHGAAPYCVPGGVRAVTIADFVQSETLDKNTRWTCPDKVSPNTARMSRNPIPVAKSRFVQADSVLGQWPHSGVVLHDEQVRPHFRDGPCVGTSRRSAARDSSRSRSRLGRHRFLYDDDFCYCMQLAELGYVTSSRAASPSRADNYVGLSMEPEILLSMQCAQQGSIDRGEGDAYPSCGRGCFGNRSARPPTSALQRK